MSLPHTEPVSRLAEAKKLTLANHFVNVFRLVMKELRSIRADPTMLVLVVYAFSISVNTVATGAVTGPSRHGAAHPAGRFCLTLVWYARPTTGRHDRRSGAGLAEAINGTEINSDKIRGATTYRGDSATGRAGSMIVSGNREHHSV